MREGRGAEVTESGEDGSIDKQQSPHIERIKQDLRHLSPFFLFELYQENNM